MSDEKVEVKEGKNPLNAKLRVLEARVDRIAEFLEVMYGHDIDGDGKIGSYTSKVAKIAGVILLGLTLFTGNVFGFAATTNAPILAYTDGVTDTNYVFELTSGGNLKINGTLTGALSGSLSAANLIAGTTASAINGTSITNLNAANLTAGSTASAINGTSITNLNAASLRAGTTAPAINGTSITNLNAANLAGTCAAINGAAVTALSPANLTAGGAMSAVNGASITNLTTANLNGTMSAANLTAGTAASAINGASITNLTTANLNGTMSAANLTAGTAASAINGNGITNLNAANLTGTFPSEGVQLSALADGILGSVTIATAPVSTTQATITVTCLDVNGGATGTKAIEFWFTTAAVSTVASTNGIESWSYVAHGDVRRYDYNGTAVVGYIGTTHTDGTMDFLVTSEAAGWTNKFAVLAPNGIYTNLSVRYVAP